MQTSQEDEEDQMKMRSELSLASTMKLVLPFNKNNITSLSVKKRLLITSYSKFPSFSSSLFFAATTAIVSIILITIPNTSKCYALPSQSNQPEHISMKLASGPEASALTYLQKFGYMNAQALNSNANNLISEDSFTNAIRSFQKFASINETGLIDDETMKMMQTPRCGNSDRTDDFRHMSHLRPNESFVPQGQHLTRLGSLRRLNLQRNSQSRRKRYALQGSKWRRQELTYRISQYPTRFSGKRNDVDGQIEKAFSIWSRVAPIDFVVKPEGKVHIDIRFASGEHGDGDAFDGPGNTLAHAYFPQYGGDAHFDDQEYWTIDSYTGTNIFQVAAHELGHSLGLGHSNVREALMAPFYQKYKPNFKLHLDDILAIQALYGEKRFQKTDDTSASTTMAPTTTTTTTTTTTSSTTSTTAEPTRDFDPTFNFDFNFGSGSTNANKPVGKETNEDENSSFPDLNSNGIGGGTGNSEDALGFQGGPANKFPSSSSNPADLCIDSQIDAATRTEDGNSYIFKGNFYWLLTTDGIAKGYPRRITADWEGLTGPIDAALTWTDGKTFFFKGNKYWRFRNRRRDIGYPKLISAGFSGIPDDIDAAFVWSGNGRTYIFKGSQYWRYDSKADPPVSSEYPRSIKTWRGVPYYVNAAFKWENNVTYFFKGSQYYRFNDKEFRVETRGRPPFPRSTSEWWFGCTNSNGLVAAQKAAPTNMMRPKLGSLVTETNHEWALLPSNIGSALFGTHINDGQPTENVNVPQARNHEPSIIDGRHASESGSLEPGPSSDQEPSWPEDNQQRNNQNNNNNADELIDTRWLSRRNLHTPNQSSSTNQKPLSSSSSSAIFNFKPQANEAFILSIILSLLSAISMSHLTLAPG